MAHLTTTDLLKAATAELSALRRQGDLHHARAAAAGRTLDPERERKVQAAAIEQLADHAMGALSLARVCREHGDAAGYSDIHTLWLDTTRRLIGQARAARGDQGAKVPA